MIYTRNYAGMASSVVSRTTLHPCKPLPHVPATSSQVVYPRCRGVVSAIPERPILAENTRQKDNPWVIGLVSAMTESLRLLGVGEEKYREYVSQAVLNDPPKEGDLDEVMRRIGADFQQGYIITGLIDDSIYEDDCYFADPTVSFTGLGLWKRNLQLLVPFLEDPEVKMTNIQMKGRDDREREVLESRWSLRTYLKLPWRPLISILGSTQYTLNPSGNRVARHVEEWDVSGIQAIAQMFKASDRAWR